MAWDDWVPGQESWVDYLTRHQNEPRPYQEASGVTDPAAQAPIAAAPGATPTPAAPTGTPSFAEYLKANPDKGDAWAYLESLLTEYGLEDLVTFTQDSMRQNLSKNEIVQRMRNEEPYKKRFKVIADRKAQGLPAISEGEVVTYERQATALLRSSGLPKGFWDDPEDFYKLQMSDISLSELESRVNKGYVAALRAPQDVRDEWKNLYGLSEGDLAAMYLDPSRTEAVLQERQSATMRAAEAARSGFGSLTVQQAEQLARLGISADQSASGFNDLTAQRELMSSLPGQQDSAIGTDEQLAAAFENNGGAQQKIKKVAEQRTAVFKGGGGFAGNKDGFAGIGTNQ